MKMRGFTLLELLLAIALIGGVAAMSVPITYMFVIKNNISLAESASVHAMRRAATLSAASSGDAVWGVYVQSGSVTVFKGADYATRDTAYDEMTTISEQITPSGLTEVTFARYSGFPDSTGTLTLETENGLSETVILNAYGTLTY